MKYANYKFSARNINNLGDQLQIVAIDNIYKLMGINQEDIVYIDYRDLRQYDGEYVILPVTMPMVDYVPNGFSGRFSEHIIPVFIGVTMIKQKLSIEEVNYLKRYEPIGCRDEYTLQTMRKYGILSYLHGCITITLPLRKEDCYEDIFIVDVDNELVNQIPLNIREKALFRTHQREDITGDIKDAAICQYNEYKNNAKLVVTSLLHCALPCLAAGIPVVILRKEITFRMSWLDKIIPINTSKDIESINWNPISLDLEGHKKRIIELTIDRLKQSFERYHDMFDVSFYYENRNKNLYVNDACAPLVDYLNDNWKERDKKYLYSIWGLHQTAEWIVDYITENYPNAELCHIYDSYRQMEFRGIVSQTPDNIANYRDETVLVTVSGARKSAEDLFKKIGLPKNQYVLF